MADSAGSTPAPASQSGLRRFPDRWYCTLICGVYFGFLGFTLMGVVPNFERMFEEMNILEYLPSMTATVILCSRWTCRWWFLYVPAAIYLSLLVALIPPKRRWMFEIVLICTMVAVTGFIVYSLFLPRIDIQEFRAKE